MTWEHTVSHMVTWEHTVKHMMWEHTGTMVTWEHSDIHGDMVTQSDIHGDKQTSILRRALSHSFWPGPVEEQMLSSELIESVTALT